MRACLKTVLKKEERKEEREGGRKQLVFSLILAYTFSSPAWNLKNLISFQSLVAMLLVARAFSNTMFGRPLVALGRNT